MLPNNSYTVYIQRSKQFTQQFERLVFVLVEEEIFFCGVVGPDVFDTLVHIAFVFNLLTSSLTKYVFYNWLINNILYLCVT